MGPDQEEPTASGGRPGADGPALPDDGPLAPTGDSPTGPPDDELAGPPEDEPDGRPGDELGRLSGNTLSGPLGDELVGPVGDTGVGPPGDELTGPLGEAVARAVGGPPPAALGEGPLALPPGRLVPLPGRGEVFVRRCGEAHPGPPLLLLHGWTVTADINFWGCYGALAERFEVIALDHRGHGRSSRPPGRFTLEDCADDAAALLAELGCGRAVLVGYSMGGPIAQLLWRRHPRLVAGLVLAATAGSFRVGPGDRVYFGAFDRLAAAARRAPPALAEQAFARARSGRLSRLALEDWALADLALGDALALLEAGSALGSFSSAGWALDIDVPTAVVVTERDTKVRPERQHHLAKAIPGARTFSADADHHDIHREPDDVLPALLTACTDVVGRARDVDGPALSAGG